MGMTLKELLTKGEGTLSAQEAKALAAQCRMDLGALWDLSDFANILMVYCNLPLQYLGLKYVTRAWKHFEKQDGTPFTSEIAGIDVPVWEEKAGKA